MRKIYCVPCFLLMLLFLLLSTEKAQADASKARGEYRIEMTGRKDGGKYWKIHCFPSDKDRVHFRIHKFTINDESGGGYRDKDEYTGVWNIFITNASGYRTLKSWQNADVDLSALLHINAYDINHDMTMEKAAEYACKNFYKVK